MDFSFHFTSFYISMLEVLCYHKVHKNENLWDSRICRIYTVPTVLVIYSLNHRSNLTAWRIIGSVGSASVGRHRGDLADEARTGSCYCVVLGFIPFLVKSDSLQQ